MRVISRIVLCILEINVAASSLSFSNLLDLKWLNADKSSKSA